MSCYITTGLRIVVLSPYLNSMTSLLSLGQLAFHHAFQYGHLEQLDVIDFRYCSLAVPIEHDCLCFSENTNKLPHIKPSMTQTRRLLEHYNSPLSLGVMLIMQHTMSNDNIQCQTRKQCLKCNAAENKSLCSITDQLILTLCETTTTTTKCFSCLVLTIVYVDILETDK